MPSSRAPAGSEPRIGRCGRDDNDANRPPVRPAGDARPTVRRTYAVLVGLTTLSILIQAVTAGLFVNQNGGAPDAWTEVHGPWPTP